MLARMTIAILLALLISIPAYAQDVNSQFLDAARNGQTEKVQALLEAGADVDAKDKYGTTILILATAAEHTDTVQVLLDAGADVNAKTNDGKTALILASANGHTEVVELLKKAGAKE